MNDSDCPVRFDALSKRFGSTVALDGVTAELARGHVFGLLGPNGAGKSTLLRHAIGLHFADSGRALTFGVHAPELGPEQMARIGFVDQGSELFDWLTVEQHLAYIAALQLRFDWDFARKYLTRFELPADRRVRELSPGVRQRLLVLLAIAHDPELLLLDEPAASLDPLMRAEFLDLLLDLIQNGRRTIVISSHILSDVERVVDRVLILNHGKLICDAELDALKEQYLRARLVGTLPAKVTLPGLFECRRAESQALLTLRGASRESIERFAAEAGCSVEIEGVSFEEIYRHEIGRSA
jgi:ABC-2 type transport system ATP-binding protein